MPLFCCSSVGGSCYPSAWITYSRWCHESSPAVCASASAVGGARRRPGRPSTLQYTNTVQSVRLILDHIFLFLSIIQGLPRIIKGIFFACLVGGTSILVNSWVGCKDNKIYTRAVPPSARHCPAIIYVAHFLLCARCQYPELMICKYLPINYYPIYPRIANFMITAYLSQDLQFYLILNRP